MRTISFLPKQSQETEKLPMVSDSVILRIEEHIGYVVLNRPESGNIVNQEMAYMFKDVCAKINQNAEIYVVVVTGAGETFCDGSELEKLLINGSMDADYAKTLIDDFSIATSVSSIDKPVIVAINGNAMGQGLELALACDIRYASDGSHFGLLQVSQGLIPMSGGTQRLPRLVGKGQALELILTARIIDTREALRIGLINKRVTKEMLNSEVEAVVKLIATKGPVALKLAKEAISRGLESSLEEGLGLEMDLYSLLQTTDDRREGIQAFLEKRQPKFKGQ
ncbi:MAG: enoyl-CoA hydratase [Dehalococcoidales bacterium]|jgi:enoyl-CoA hydratase|nr:enoyl-CoA hydratase [Dehalococcoidales bacterium]